MDNKKSDIINKRKYHQPKAVVKGKDGKVINILENNHTKEKNSEKAVIISHVSMGLWVEKKEFMPQMPSHLMA